MRVRLSVALLLFSLIANVAGWSKEDHEIFSLRDQLAASEGSEITFYDFLGVKASASQEEIQKAYRKKSRLIHPDKVKSQLAATRSREQAADKKAKKGKKPGVVVSKPPSQAEVQKAIKKATERWARLGVVATILKGPSRQRYDHFLKNGFPAWKGTGYYYARFRPGLTSVLLGLFIVCGGGAHYGALYMSWKRQREFVQRYITHARRAAWGNDVGISGIPGVDSAGTPASVPAPQESDGGMQGLNRKQRRMQEKENKKGKGSKESGRTTPPEVPVPKTGHRGDKKKVVAENGKVLLVDSVGNVYLEEENEEGETEAYLLDIEEIRKPTIKDTALFRFPIWAFYRSFGRLLGSGSPATEAATLETQSDSGTESDDAVLVEKPGANGAASRKRNRRKGKQN
ncbi:MAG: DnaJ sub C member 1 [Vezdaea acicularis]|nr:MAG: DnaJ sub C member 1 [Vezdaea acicularis]